MLTSAGTNLGHFNTKGPIGFLRTFLRFVFWHWYVGKKKGLNGSVMCVPIMIFCRRVRSGHQVHPRESAVVRTVGYNWRLQTSNNLFDGLFIAKFGQELNERDKVPSITLNIRVHWYSETALKSSLAFQRHPQVNSKPTQSNNPLRSRCLCFSCCSKTPFARLRWNVIIYNTKFLRGNRKPRSSQK